MTENKIRTISLDEETKAQLDAMQYRLIALHDLLNSVYHAHLEPFSVSWTGKRGKNQSETQDFADFVNVSANLFGASHPIPECGLTEL